MKDNIRRIQLGKIDSIDSFKFQILHNLKLIDFKKNCLGEFEIRLNNYINRNPKLTIQLEVNIKEVSENFRKRIAGEISKTEIPDNYEFGNPFNRWIFDPVTKTQDEHEHDNRLIENKLAEEMTEFKNIVETLKRFITIKKEE